MRTRLQPGRLAVVAASAGMVLGAASGLLSHAGPSACTGCDVAAPAPAIVAEAVRAGTAAAPQAASAAASAAIAHTAIVPEPLAGFAASAPHDMDRRAIFAEARADQGRFETTRLQGAAAARSGGGGGGASGVSGGGGGGIGMGAGHATAHAASTSHASVTAARSPNARSSSASTSSHASTGEQHASPVAAVAQANPSAVVMATPAAAQFASFTNFTAPPSQAGGGMSSAAPVAGGLSHASGHGAAHALSVRGLSATPEPGTLLLMLTGFVGLVGYRQRANR